MVLEQQVNSQLLERTEELEKELSKAYAGIKHLHEGMDTHWAEYMYHSADESTLEAIDRALEDKP